MYSQLEMIVKYVLFIFGRLILNNNFNLECMYTCLLERKKYLRTQIKI